jgi:hypothetical protein
MNSPSKLENTDLEMPNEKQLAMLTKADLITLVTEYAGLSALTIKVLEKLLVEGEKVPRMLIYAFVVGIQLGLAIGLLIWMVTKS